MGSGWQGRQEPQCSSFSREWWDQEVVSRICLITSESLIPLLGEDGLTAVVLPRFVSNAATLGGCCS